MGMLILRDGVRKELRWVIFLIAILLGGFIFVQLFSKVEERTITVHHKEMVTNVSGSDGSVTTDVYYLVTTDKGNYNLKTEGLFTFQGGPVSLEVGKTYRVQVASIMEIQSLGVRPNIVKVIEEVK